MNKKIILLAMYAVLTVCNLSAQISYDLREVDNDMQTPFQIPNSSGALYTRTSNYETPNDRTIVGVVWHDAAEKAQLYVSSIEKYWTQYGKSFE
jgi:hypothetical protein